MVKINVVVISALFMVGYFIKTIAIDETKGRYFVRTFGVDIREMGMKTLFSEFAKHRLSFYEIKHLRLFESIKRRVSFIQLHFDFLCKIQQNIL